MLSSRIAFSSGPSVGLTSIQGSTSLLRKLVPVWPVTLSRVQVAIAGGATPETWTSGPMVVKGVAAAG